MIDVERKEEVDKPPINYPKLMISKADGLIVMMIEEETGYVIDGRDPAGYYSDNWFMPNFKDYTGSVTLSNAKG